MAKWRVVMISSEAIVPAGCAWNPTPTPTLPPSTTLERVDVENAKITATTLPHCPPVCRKKGKA